MEAGAEASPEPEPEPEAAQTDALASSDVSAGQGEAEERQHRELEALLKLSLRRCHTRESLQQPRSFRVGKMLSLLSRLENSKLGGGGLGCRQHPLGPPVAKALLVPLPRHCHCQGTVTVCGVSDSQWQWYRQWCAVTVPTQTVCGHCHCQFRPQCALPPHRCVHTAAGFS